MPEQIPEQVKTERSNCLLALEEEMASAYRETFYGKEVQVLFEEEKYIDDTCYWIGHTPEYISVALQYDGDLTNTIQTVMICEALNKDYCLA